MSCDSVVSSFSSATHRVYGRRLPDCRVEMAYLDRMEPASTPAPPPAEPNQYPAPSPYAADPQAPAEIGPPGAYAQPGPPAPRAPGEARIGVIVLTALVLELLLIGIGANQWVTDRLLRATPGSRMEQLIQFSWLTFNW